MRGVLIRARARIADPAHWVQLYYTACDRHGNPCLPRDPQAVAWDMLGAVFAETDHWPTRYAIRDSFTAICGQDPCDLNRMGHLAVLAAFDKLIGMLPEEP